MMTAVEWKEALAAGARGRVLREEPLRGYTSFRVGGPAEILFFPSDGEDLAAALRVTRAAGVPVLVLGNGTNVLAGDGGVRGLVVQTGSIQGVEADPAAPASPPGGAAADVTAGAGTLLSRVINFAVDRGLSGLEFAAGIPGTVGGAAVMNAGAHGACFGDIVRGVELVTIDGERRRLARPEMTFSYRGSSLAGEGIVTAVEMRLVARGEAQVLERVKECLSLRQKRLPFGLGNAGSVFKNPPGDYAGRLIESLGMKGLTRGGARVSTKHANVIVNTGTATAADIRRLLEEVARRVAEGTGVHLEPEIRIVGEE